MRAGRRRSVSEIPVPGRSRGCYSRSVNDEPVPAAESKDASTSWFSTPRAKRARFFSIWGAVALTVVLLFRAVLLPFFLAIVLAYVFEPIVSSMVARPIGGRKLPRWAAVVTLYLGLLTTLGVFVAIGVPRLAVEIERLAEDVPGAIEQARERWLPEIRRRLQSAMVLEGAPPPTPTTPDGSEVPPESLLPNADAASDTIRVVPIETGGYEIRLPQRGIVVTDEGNRLLVTEARHATEHQRGDLAEAVVDSLQNLSVDTSSHAGSLLGAVKTAIGSFVRGVFLFFIMLMLSAYILITKDGILEFFRVLVQPANRERFDSLLRRIDKGLSGVVRGQLVICLVNGVLSGIGFYALGLRYWPILTLVATVFSIIPIFGAILSSVPAVVIGLQMSPTTGLLALVWILLIHQIEANLLNPKILGDAAKVHPVLVVFALLAGEHLFGIAGALLAVPVLSITQSIFLHNRESSLGIPAPKSDRTLA